MIFGRSLLSMFLSIPAILIAFTAKEYIRARVAYNLGDRAQKIQGRMTLDPFAHIDLIGFVLIIITGFGWSKPAYVNRNAFKRPKEDSIKVTLAAFSSYLIVAVIGQLLITLLFLSGIGGDLKDILHLVLSAVVSINVSLFVFNLIPMPGLEMFNLVSELSPSFAYKAAQITGQYNLIILLVIVVGADFILWPPITYILGLLNQLSLLIVGMLY